MLQAKNLRIDDWLFLLPLRKSGDSELDGGFVVGTSSKGVFELEVAVEGDDILLLILVLDIEGHVGRKFVDRADLIVVSNVESHKRDKVCMD